MSLEKRLIGQYLGPDKGPVLIFFAGIHGNEPAGVRALEHVFQQLNKEHLEGSIYAFKGNLSALEENKRYLEQDLNRMWTEVNIKFIQGKNELTSEEKELLQLLNIIQDILKKHNGPLYFFDLHTTSSKSIPFITINDALMNRSFSKLFPVPTVLGIEEYLEGPLLSYINQLGYVSLGFESGQHDDPKAIENSVAFISLAMVVSGCVDKRHLGNYELHVSLLQEQSRDVAAFFEIMYLYNLTTNENFKMKHGFDSFQKINKGMEVATNRDGIIRSKYNGRIFMPLYQKRGLEGFFIIRPINSFFLGLSKLLRYLKTDGFLVCLPGIKWQNREKGILAVNLKIARFMAKPLFHLLGYRSKHITKTHLYLYNRERVAKTKMYKDVIWN